MKLLRIWLVMVWPLCCFGQFGGVQQPMFATNDPCAWGWPQDAMNDYAVDATINGLNGGCLWNGAYVSFTYSNLQNTLWYVDANDEYDVEELLMPDANGNIGGTNYIWIIDHETVTVTTNAWTNAFVLGVYTNYFNFLYHVDAADEYTTNNLTDITNAVAGLAKGTNWLLLSTAYASTTTTNEQSWTNAYACSVYTNSYNTLQFVDAMDEYAEDAGVTNLAGGTNWIYIWLKTNNMAGDLAATQQWTNVYACKDY